MKLRQGFSLVELMIGLLLSSFILIGSFRIYQAVSGFFVTQVEFLNQVEKKQMMTAIIKNTLDHAGFMSCSDPQKWMDLGSIGSSTFAWSMPVVYGIDGSDTKSLEKFGLDGRIVSHSDALVIQGSMPFSTLLKSNRPAGARTVKLPLDWGVGAGDYLIFADCLSFYMVEVKERKDSGSIKFVSPLMFDLKKGMTASIWQRYIFYVGETSLERNGKPITALFVQDGKGVDREVVEYVDGLTFEYGILGGEGALLYVSPSEVKNWHDVTMIRMNIDLPGRNDDSEIDIALKRNLP
jgi:hypothetical protein